MPEIPALNFMKPTPHPIILPLLAVLGFLGSSNVPRAEAPPSPSSVSTSLFDGKSLAGWDGDEKIWRVVEGAIAGGSLAEEMKENQFAATLREYSNFIVRFQIKLTGKEGFVNSGIQIRSQRVAGKSGMVGYQCDWGDPTWWGCIYDEGRRDKLLAQSNIKVIGPVVKRNDWNNYVIRADGPRITTWINGVMAVDYTETDPGIPQTGRMGIQIHGGGKALVEVINLTIEELPTEKNNKAEAKKDESGKE